MPTTAESIALGKPLGGIYIKDAAYMDVNGNPDNELVGRYQFLVTFNDGTIDNTQPYKLAIDNDPTDITSITNLVSGQIRGREVLPSPPDPGSPLVLNYTQGDTINLDPTARDEYDPATRNHGYYTLQVDWNNDGGFVTISDPGGQRAPNGEPITFNSETGVITWHPNNVDVPEFGSWFPLDSLRSKRQFRLYGRAPPDSE